MSFLVRHRKLISAAIIGLAILYVMPVRVMVAGRVPAQAAQLAAILFRVSRLPVHQLIVRDFVSADLHSHAQRPAAAGPDVASTHRQFHTGTGRNAAARISHDRRTAHSAGRDFAAGFGESSQAVLPPDYSLPLSSSPVAGLQSTLNFSSLLEIQ